MPDQNLDVEGYEKYVQSLQQPQGAPSPAPQAPQAQPSMGSQIMEQIKGRAPNALAMGLTGARMGMAVAPMTGPMGPAAFGLAGAVAGAAMPMTDSPYLDYASTLATELAGAVPGGPMAKFAAGTALQLGLGYAGTLADRGPDVTKDLNVGKLALYTGMTAGGLALSEIVKSATRGGAAESARQQISRMTGTDIPLSVGEKMPAFGKVEELMTQSSERLKQLGLAQSDAYQSALEKVVPGTGSWEKIRGTLELLSSMEPDIYAAGQGAQKQFGKGFAKNFNLTPEEAIAFEQGIKKNAAPLVNKILPKDETSPQGIMLMRGLMKFLPPEGQETVGSAVLGRLLAKNNAFVQTKQGVVLSGDGFIHALNKIGDKDLTVMFGKERAEALLTLGDAMMEADPAVKQMSKTDLSQRAFVYLANKALFTASSMAAAGGAVGAASGMGAVAGGAAGFAAGVTLFSLAGKIMTNPKLAKAVYTAAKYNDPRSAAYVLRTLASATSSEQPESSSYEPQSTPASKTTGLFQKP